MNLPVMPPVSPMLARAAAQIPLGDGFIYEPKWDGFRAVFYRDGDEVEITSRNERSLARYFPELVVAARRELPPRCVIDGEIVVAGEAGLDFDALSQRIHPAPSRILSLSRSTPAHFVVFDALAWDDTDLRPLDFADRRAFLERQFGAPPGAGKVESWHATSSASDHGPSIHLTPATTDGAQAQGWFSRFEGAGLDGVMAKEARGAYRPGERTMTKVKHVRDADCVIGGLRWYQNKPGTVGSLLLGLHDVQGQLHHVGVAGSFPMAKRRELTQTLGRLILPDGSAHPWLDPPAAARSDTETSRPVLRTNRDTHPTAAPTTTNRRPGSESRWSSGRDTAWVALRPELVCEVSYGQLSSGRFRHNAIFRRFRPDRDPASCSYAQLEVPVPLELAQVFPS